MSSERLVKVRFDLTKATNRNELPDELVGETLWAEALGDDRYRLRNSPAHALGYAETDTVHCVRNPSSGWLEVCALAEDSGKGTVRVYFCDSWSESSARVIDELKSYGCTYERATDELVLFSVPPMPMSRFSELVTMLNTLDDDVTIGWEIGKTPTVEP